MFAYGNDGYISDRGDELRITSDSSPIRIRTLNYGSDPDLGVDMATFTPSGAVSLFYGASVTSSSKKFETTTDGVKITGGLQDKDGDLGTSGQVLTSTGTQLNWVSSSSVGENTQLSTEEVQDIVGAMVSSNTETRIGVTYDLSLIHI